MIFVIFLNNVGILRFTDQVPPLTFIPINSEVRTVTGQNDSL